MTTAAERREKARELAKPLPKHSQAWWEGYAWQGPRMCNPYNFNTAPGLFNDWVEGWTVRFHGEAP